MDQGRGTEEKEPGYLGTTSSARPPQDLTFVHPGLWVPGEGCPGAEAAWGLLFGASTSSSPQPQHSHLVIQQLLSHLDANSRSAATVRAGIVEVLSEAAVIAATGSVGKGALGDSVWGLGSLQGQRAAPGRRLPPLPEKGKGAQGGVRAGFLRKQSAGAGCRGRGRHWLERRAGENGPAEGSSPGSRVSHPLCSGPTVLEMFNTLLRQLRLSIDYALTGSYDGAISLGTKIIKEHEERMFQEAVIKTIGGRRDGA